MVAEQSEAEFWAGWYGIQYTTKFAVDWRERIPFLRKIIERTGARSVLDVGTNAGWNLRALREIDPSLELAGVEINPHVAVSAASMGLTVHCGPAAGVGEQFPASNDLVITSGLLIHIPPNEIDRVMRSIVQASRRWVLAVEYSAPDEQVVRRHDDIPRAWARPYGPLYQKLGLVTADVGHGIAGYPDCTYWLMEKPGG